MRGPPSHEAPEKGKPENRLFLLREHARACLCARVWICIVRTSKRNADLSTFRFPWILRGSYPEHAGLENIAI